MSDLMVQSSERNIPLSENKIMAKIVYLTYFSYFVFRFLGTTPKSSTILRVLKSIMLQIKHVYKFSAKIPRVSERFYNTLFI